MRSSSLRQKITFQKFSEMRDDFGGVTESWTNMAPDTWAQIIPLKGEERYESSHLQTIVDHKIRMRYRSDINAKMRIVYGARVFGIDSIINPYERNRELQIMATEVLDG